LWRRELKNFYTRRSQWGKGRKWEGVDLTPVFEKELEKKGEHPILIVGEAPGKDEVAQGTPFVGKAGENLQKLIKLSGLSRERDFLITNTFPFRTFTIGKNGKISNRTPSTQLLKEGSRWLEQEIGIVEPSLILLLGNSALRGFGYLIKGVDKLPKCGFYYLHLPGEKVPPLPEGVEPIEVESLPPYFEKNRPIVGVCYHPSPLAFNRPKIRQSLEKFFKQLPSLVSQCPLR